LQGTPILPPETSGGYGGLLLPVTLSEALDERYGSAPDGGYNSTLKQATFLAQPQRTFISKLIKDIARIIINEQKYNKNNNSFT
jgi:hypothetical protein